MKHKSNHKERVKISTIVIRVLMIAIVCVVIGVCVYLILPFGKGADILKTFHGLDVKQSKAIKALFLNSYAKSTDNYDFSETLGYSILPNDQVTFGGMTSIEALGNAQDYRPIAKIIAQQMVDDTTECGATPKCTGEYCNHLRAVFNVPTLSGDIVPYRSARCCCCGVEQIAVAIIGKTPIKTLANGHTNECSLSYTESYDEDYIKDTYRTMYSGINNLVKDEVNVGTVLAYSKLDQRFTHVAVCVARDSEYVYILDFGNSDNIAKTAQQGYTYKMKLTDTLYDGQYNNYSTAAVTTPIVAGRYYLSKLVEITDTRMFRLFTGELTN